MANLKLLYAGSFDPLHWGHCDIIDRARFMGDLTVLVASNENKKHLFGIKDRVKMIKNVYSNTASGVVPDVIPMHCGVYTGKWAKENKFDYLVRGLRTADAESELALAAFNEEHFYIDTILIPCKPSNNSISSSAIKQIISCEGWNKVIDDYVPYEVKRWLQYLKKENYDE